MNQIMIHIVVIFGTFRNGIVICHNMLICVVLVELTSHFVNVNYVIVGEW